MKNKNNSNKLNISISLFSLLPMYSFYLVNKLLEGASSSEDLYEITCVEFYCPINEDEKILIEQYINEIKQIILN